MRDIRITWKGKPLTIPASRAFEVGEAVEDIITLREIATWGDRPKFFKMARAYAAILRVAGVIVTPEAVHAEIMRTVPAGQENFAMAGLAALAEILMGDAPVLAAADDAAEKPTAS